MSEKTFPIVDTCFLRITNKRSKIPVKKRKDVDTMMETSDKQKGHQNQDQHQERKRQDEKEKEKEEEEEDQDQEWLQAEKRFRREMQEYASACPELVHARDVILQESQVGSQEDNYIVNHLRKEDPFVLIESYFRAQHLERLVRHQIESYNHFINYQIQRTIEMFNEVMVKSNKYYLEKEGVHALEIGISFHNLKLHTPQIHENNGATKMMMPNEARLRNFTYAANMTVDVHVRYIIRDSLRPAEDPPRIIEKVLPKINIGKMPVMLKSSICVLTQNRHISSTYTGECPMDCGGYFIVKGSEKTVLGQERPAENRIYCFDGKNTAKWSWYAEIRSVPENKCVSPKQVEMLISCKNNGDGHPIYVCVPRLKQPIDLFVLFRALGVEADKDVCDYILLNCDDEQQRPLLECLKASIVESRRDGKYATQEEAFQHMVTLVAYNSMNVDKDTALRRKREVAHEIVRSDLLPNCRTLPQKLLLLGIMCKKLLQVSLGWIAPDDRDSYINKRIELTGTLMNHLFRNFFNKMIKEMQKKIVLEINSGSWKTWGQTDDDYENIINPANIYKIIKSTTIETGINRALATGDFSVKQGNSSKMGVAQVLNRLTYVASLSHLRRINTPLEKSGELIEPRKLHNTTWGYFCPAETPEGQSIGVVKNISYMAHVTIPVSTDNLCDIVRPFLLSAEEMQTPRALFQRVKIVVNGACVGCVKEGMHPQQVFDHLKEKKLCGAVNVYTSIVFDYKQMEIRLCNDGGRFTRPVLRVRDNKALLTRDIVDRVANQELAWNDLLTNCRIPESVIEYIDPEEQNYAMIAMRTRHPRGYVQDPSLRIRYTHCEIHPSTIFGVLASCIPFPEYNQAPRNTYQCAMGKQAIGVYSTNFDQRMDKTAYVLWSPSRPLIDTRLMNFIKLHQIPSGCTIHVAIMSYTGYNQEDSVLMNKGSIDRGLFMATIYHCEKDEDNNVVRDEIIRCKPEPLKTKGTKYGNYDKLMPNGFMPENALVENRDVIIAKVVPIKENRNDPTQPIKFQDQSKTYRTHEESYIDRNYTGRNGDGYNFAKVRVRTIRKPVYGDKFSSRMGQKGTCGNIIPECDMPYTKDGLRPDIIINPHAIPSRMTIAQLKETMLGKVLLELGLFGDGSSFGDLSIKEIAEHLQALGYESYGNEILYDGLSGKQLEVSIFFGPCFYQRLKHMVNDKQHSRAFGPMMNLTRQPAEGRSRDGGFRIGEMERDVMIAHGMAYFCKERLFDVSDRYFAYVCRRCGMLAAYNDGKLRARGIHAEDAQFTIYHCKTCDNRTDFAKVAIPYAYKLMSQELQAINVVPRLITDSS